MKRVAALVMVFTGLLAAVVGAASLAITRAQWDGSRLTARGTAPAGTTVTVTTLRDAALAQVKASSRGTWSVSISGLARVPCGIRAVQQPTAVERAVDGAPSSCEAAAPTLTSVTVSGPASLTEGGQASYSATAAFSDGTSQVVTASASWSENSSFATIAAGVLTAGAVAANQPVLVSASYTVNGVTRSGSVSVTIQDVPSVTGSHAGRFAIYEGTKTCLTCHETQAKAFHQSVHYQWAGDASDSVGLDSPIAGKMGGINDFCIYPNINWLGKLTNVDGQKVDGGCARCHTGLGLKPTVDQSQAQLENIDCLVCHAPGYKRTLNLVDGVWRFVPDTASMTVSVLQAASDIRLPGNDQCLNCHTRAGGGDNFKRGDLSEAHRRATPSLDVHMASRASGGAGLTCRNCHVTVAHKIAGRGVDMRQRDFGTPAVQCSDCHSTAPHGDSSLNRHTARVACNVCHVPAFAKAAPTDMRRDWSLAGEVSTVTRLWEPHMLMQSNVTPVYRFFNGRSQFYQFGAKAVPQANGRVLMAGPLGSVQEPGSKITAMKRHEGRQPIDPITGVLLPLKIGTFFQWGDLPGAVAQGVSALGWPSNGHTFVETERFMGVYHEVAPHDSALKCGSCHEGGRRLDFAALGYTPVAVRNGRPLCSSCHSAKTAESFYALHDKHVKDKGLNCSTCHTFSKAL